MVKLRKLFIYGLLSVSTLGLISGCGLKGPLYQKKPQPESPKSESTTQADDTTK